MFLLHREENIQGSRWYCWWTLHLESTSLDRLFQSGWWEMNNTVTNTWPLWIFLIRLNSAKRMAESTYSFCQIYVDSFSSIFSVLLHHHESPRIVPEPPAGFAGFCFQDFPVKWCQMSTLGISYRGSWCKAPKSYFSIADRNLLLNTLTVSTMVNHQYVSPPFGEYLSFFVQPSKSRKSDHYGLPNCLPTQSHHFCNKQ